MSSRRFHLVLCRGCIHSIFTSSTTPHISTHSLLPLQGSLCLSSWTFLPCLSGSMYCLCKVFLVWSPGAFVLPTLPPRSMQPCSATSLCTSRRSSATRAGRLLEDGWAADDLVRIQHLLGIPAPFGGPCREKHCVKKHREEPWNARFESNKRSAVQVFLEHTARPERGKALTNGDPASGIHCFSKASSHTCTKAVWVWVNARPIQLELEGL